MTDYRSDVFLGLRGGPRYGLLRTRNWGQRKSGRLLPGLGLDQHSHDVTLVHYEILDAIDLDLGARPFAEQDALPDPNVDRDELTALVAATGSNGDDLGMMMPPAVFASASIRSMTTRS